MPDTYDMPGQRIEPGHIRSVWTLNEWERDAITQGLNVELNIFAEPIPPISLGVTYEEAASSIRRPGLVAERFIGSDGKRYIRLVSTSGAELSLSHGYTHRWSALLVQYVLRRILPQLEMTSS